MKLGNSKQCDRKDLVHRKTVDRAVTDHGDLTVKLTADALRLQMNHVRTKKEFWYRKRVP